VLLFEAVLDKPAVAGTWGAVADGAWGELTTNGYWVEARADEYLQLL
jgi:hypothetical protein